MIAYTRNTGAKTYQRPLVWAKLPRMVGNQSQTGRKEARRLTVAEAAEVLGITVEAVRGRIKRGTLEHERTKGGAGGGVFVLLEAKPTDRPPTGHRPDADRPSDQTQSDTTALISEMRGRIQFLEEEMQRKDAILLSMTEAVKALSPPQEAPRENAPQSSEGPGPTDTITGTPEEPQEAVQRPRWRRWLGLDR